MNIRILILDDESAVARRLRDTLDHAGYDAVSFTDADEALVNAARVSYAVALVDLRMPGRDGAEIIAELRQLSWAPSCIAMTAFPEVPQLVAAMRGGAADLLTKPIQDANLIEVVERALARHGVVASSETDFNTRLGRRLRNLRQQRDRTIQDVAVESGISPAQLSQIELGRNATTTWTLARICAALRVPLHAAFQEL
jgi:FixJ family two-component response regulator